MTLLGDGYIEVVPDDELILISNEEKAISKGKIHGEYTWVSLPENPKLRAIGRFGWKAQHGSLLGASADALHGELGVHNYLFPLSASSEKAVTTQAPAYVEARREELASIVSFIRATLPIAPDEERTVTASAVEGAKIFDELGCALCHRPTLRTAGAGVRVQGGLVSVPASMGATDIHPYSDYLIHDVGTGDGAGQSVFAKDYRDSSVNKFRTAPLWGVRYRSWLMHDGESVTYHQAIMRHSGEASDSVDAYRALTPIQKEQLRQFLDSL